MNMRHTGSLLALLAVLFLGAAGAAPFAADRALAAEYPEKQITYLVAFNPGGESDIFARAQQPLLEKELGQSVLITYKTGEGGAVGWNELVQAGPDGYVTAGFNLPHIILQPLLRAAPGYATQDVMPVMIFMSTPCVLAVPKDSPYRSLDDLLRAAREKPGSIRLGGSGRYSANHLGVSRLNKAAGADIAYVAFSGTGDAMPAFLGGHVDGLLTYTTMGVQYKDHMRVLAVASEERFAALPEAPTFKELGFDLVEGAYRGLAVPPGTPEDIVARLYKACAAVNAEPEFIKAMTAYGFRLENMDPAQSARLVEEKIPIYKDILEKLEQ